MSCKGVNKNMLKNPIEKFQDALTGKKKVSVKNRGFRVMNNTIYSYTQEKTGFGYFYCKRKVMEDGVSTSPFDMVLCPWPQYNLFPFDSWQELGMLYNCDLHKHGKNFNSALHL